MNLDKSRMVSVFVSITLIAMGAISALAVSQTDQDQIGMEDASGQVVKICAIYNLQGSQSPLDLPSARGARLAVREINALGGIDGREIELILCDGKSDPAKVRECAEGLLSNNVSAMMGLSDTDMVLAAAPVAAEAKIPFCDLRSYLSEAGRGVRNPIPGMLR